MRDKPIARFLCSFVLLYGLLIVPWPGFNVMYGNYFRALGRALFAGERGPRVLRIEPAQGRQSSIDTLITMANRDQLDANGHGRARILELDARSIGWVPTALLIALTVASPVPWKRRAWALVGGLALVHLFIFLSVDCYIWNESATVGIVSISPFWKPVADGLEETLITQLGASFVVPPIIWIVLTFRLRDLDGIAGLRRQKSS